MMRPGQLVLAKDSHRYEGSMDDPKDPKTNVRPLNPELEGGTNSSENLYYVQVGNNAIGRVRIQSSLGQIVANRGTCGREPAQPTPEEGADSILLILAD